MSIALLKRMQLITAAKLVVSGPQLARHKSVSNYQANHAFETRMKLISTAKSVTKTCIALSASGEEFRNVSETWSLTESRTRIRLDLNVFPQSENGTNRNFCLWNIWKMISSIPSKNFTRFKIFHGLLTQFKTFNAFWDQQNFVDNKSSPISQMMSKAI